MKKLFSYKSKSFNPYYNLALEDFFLNYASSNNTETFVIFFWLNSDSIIIGRNQCVLNECNIELIKKYNVLLVRRKTGGGAVFHDKNNLNFSMIIPKKHYNKEKTTQIIKNALKSLNINTEISERNDILINSKKVSGNAYFYGKETCLHHGTLLIDTDLKKLETLLYTKGEKSNNKGVKSVRSSVINLIEIDKSISIKVVEEAILNEFIKNYGEKIEPISLSKKDLDIISNKEKEFASEKWIWSKV